MYESFKMPEQNWGMIARLSPIVIGEDSQMRGDYGVTSVNEPV